MISSLAAEDAQVVVKSASQKPRPRKQRGVTLTLAVHLLHRLAIFVCAVFYVYLSFCASYDAVSLLRGRQNPSTAIEDNYYALATTAFGQGTIRESPIVKDALHGRTAPIATSIYISEKGYTFEMCENAGTHQVHLFADVFMRSFYAALTEQTSYRNAEIDPATIELIAPVVDCSSNDGGDGDATSARFFYLIRQRADTEKVAVLVTTVSNQQYSLPTLREDGPASVTVVQVISDMRSTNLGHSFAASLGYPYKKLNFRAFDYLNTTANGLWTLQSVPQSERELAKLLQTACRTGFFIKAASEQSNINNYLWLIEKNAVMAVGNLRWFSIPVLHDSWGWVHGVQFFIGINVLSNLWIVCLATYRNLSAGNWWIADAFVSISTNQILAAVAVLFSWFMNDFWSLHEFCFQEANVVSGFSSKIIYEAHTRADMLTIYLGACGLIGLVFRDRINPLVATGSFLIGYKARVQIINLFPALRDAIADYSEQSYLQGVSPELPGQSEISPMRFWTIHAIGQRNYAFVFQCLFPIYAMLVFVFLYVALRKLYRVFYPERIHVKATTTTTIASTVTESERAPLVQKGSFTLFEIATGAQMESRFGVVSDFETCIFIKGVKFASPDGIYSNGFVIANGKFLLQTRDVWSIVLMKLLRRRFRNIYVYDVSGTTVQQTARLVYPHTLTVQDLLNLNVSILS